MREAINHPAAQVLAPGKVYFDYGPVSMVVLAFEGLKPLTDLARASFAVVETGLEELRDSLELLRCYPREIQPQRLGSLALQMYEAVAAVGEPTLTPMAAVAGAMADRVADWLFAQGATRVIVNNGGDIALRMQPGEQVRVGLLSDLALGKMDQVLTLRGEDGVGGVATSGLGGRSFTRGVAQGVSALSRTCRLADALATQLANHSYIKSQQVRTAKAGLLDPLSDIADLEVVVEVGKLSTEEISLALKNLEAEAARQKAKGNLLGVVANIQGHVLPYPIAYFNKRLEGDVSYETGNQENCNKH